MNQPIKPVKATLKDGYRINADYNEYWLLKQQILERYPKWIKRTRAEQRQLMKEIGDLLFQPDGHFQRFVWENMSEFDKLIMERKARGRKKHTRIEWEGDE